MTSLWIINSLVILFCFGFVLFYVYREQAGIFAKQVTTQEKVLFLLPFLLLLVSIIYYQGTESYKKQQAWEQINQQIESFIDTELSSDKTVFDELSMQNFMLGLRTQAFKNPNNGQVWFQLGKAYAQLNMTDLALASMRRAIRVEDNPDWGVVAAQLMVSKQTQNSFQKAAILLEQVVQKHPKHQGALITLGFTYYKLTRYSDAIKLWRYLAAQKGLSQQSKQYLQKQIEEAERRITEVQ